MMNGTSIAQPAIRTCEAHDRRRADELRVQEERSEPPRVGATAVARRVSRPYGLGPQGRQSPTGTHPPQVWAITPVRGRNDAGKNRGPFGSLDPEELPSGNALSPSGVPHVSKRRERDFRRVVEASGKRRREGEGRGRGLPAAARRGDPAGAASHQSHRLDMDSHALIRQDRVAARSGVQARSWPNECRPFIGGRPSWVSLGPSCGYSSTCRRRHTDGIRIVSGRDGQIRARRMRRAKPGHRPRPMRKARAPAPAGEAGDKRAARRDLEAGAARESSLDVSSGRSVLRPQAHLRGTARRMSSVDRTRSRFRAGAWERGTREENGLFCHSPPATHPFSMPDSGRLLGLAFRDGPLDL